MTQAITPVIVFILIAVGIAGFYLFGLLSNDSAEPVLESQETVVQSQETNVPVSQTPASQASTVKGAQTNPSTNNSGTKNSSEEDSGISINTYITSGPENGEIIEDTNKVTFRFKGKASPSDTQGTIRYDVKVQGLDSEWTYISRNYRTITLPAGAKEYTFLVRAKINGVTDPTPAKRTFKLNISPYFNKIRIYSTSIQTFYRSYSQVQLSTSLARGEEIDITGWTLKGKWGTFIFPQGLEKYYPWQGKAPVKDIIIKQGDRIYLPSGKNPLGEYRSFRENKCLGYLTDYYDFSIPIYNSCPRPDKDETSELEPCCQEFISDLGRCEIPDYSQSTFISYNVAEDLECVSYLNRNFNYGGCYRNYSRDADFLKNKWYIYTGRNLVVDDDCDTFYLRDKNGLIVDVYDYGRALCK